MSVSRYPKKIKLIATAILAPFFVCIACLMLVSCTLDKDIKYDKAISIAKKDFGCEKILWIDTNALVLGVEPGSENTPNRMRSHYTFYVVGEKDGEEIYLVIPSNPKLEKPYESTWCFDFTFKQIVDEFNELGAGYVIDVPDDFYSKSHDNYLDIVVREEYINLMAKNYEIDEPETFYERLDAKVVFSYRRVDNDIIYDYIVAQIDGELVSYEDTQVLVGNTQ